MPFFPILTGESDQQIKKHSMPNTTRWISLSICGGMGTEEVSSDEEMKIKEA